MPRFTIAIALALVGAACDLTPGGGMLVDDSAPPPSGQTDPSGPSDAADAADAAARAPEFPCEVRGVLETYCAPCHAGTTYTVEFKSREVLLRPWGDAGTFGQHAATLVMMAQMPPTSAARFPTADERVILIDWVAAGMPAGPCGALSPP